MTDETTGNRTIDGLTDAAEGRFTVRTPDTGGAGLVERLRASEPYDRNVSYRRMRTADIEEAAARITALEREVEGMREVFSGIKWRSVCRYNMEFSATVTYWQMDAIKEALSPAQSGEGG